MLLFLSVVLKSAAQNDTVFFTQTESRLQYHFLNLIQVDILRHSVDSLNVEVRLTNKSNAKIGINTTNDLEEDIDTGNVNVGYVPFSDHEYFLYNTAIIYPAESYTFSVTNNRKLARCNIGLLIYMNADDVIKRVSKKNCHVDSSGNIKTVFRSSNDGITSRSFMEIYVENLSDASSKSKVKIYGRVRR